VRFAYYPGCSLESTAWDYDRSTRAVCGALGIDLVEIRDWTCCGSTPAHVSNASLAVGLSVLNLQKAAEMDLPIMTACASCYSRLRTANYKVREEREERERAEKITGKPYDGGVEVLHVLDVLANRLGEESIRQSVNSPLTGLKAASYYGCLLSRPPEVVAFESADHPTSMDRILDAVGATPVEWPYKTECCGAGLSMSRADAVERLTARLLAMAREAGAECLALACPMCHVNLDLRQRDAMENHAEVTETPILYLTQLLGLALGLSEKELGLNALTISAAPLLKDLRTRTAAGQGSEL
jgi:heterodisulfide reductase subunit B